MNCYGQHTTRLLYSYNKYHRRLFVPTIDLTTDNAAMIAVCGYFKYLQNDFSTIHSAPYSTAGITLKTLTELPK